jgi:hypothetical protein
MPTPITAIHVVTPSDDSDLPQGTCLGMIFNGQGDITFTTAEGGTVTLLISPYWFGGVHFLRASRIHASGTTLPPGSIFACYGDLI